MLSNFYSASRSSVENVTSQPEPPPPYVEGNHFEKRTVEVCEPPPNSEFEPVERQRHFGILRYTVNNRFKTLILIGIANFALFILFGVVLIIILVTLKTNKESTVTTTAATRIAELVTTATTASRIAEVVTTATTTTATSAIVTTTSSTKMTTVTQPSTKLTTVPPKSTTTRLSTTTSVEPIEPDSCTPLDSTTFLFAYSNDFNSSLVNSLVRYFLPSKIPPHYTTFASIRFDTKNKEEFEYQNTIDEFVTYVDNHLPDPSLSFDSKNTGSDVLQIFDKFLDNTVVPVCGSRMIIYAKRYPNETDYSHIVAKMRQHHSYLTIFATTEPSGGSRPETLYDLASKTNGICAFDDDANIIDAEGFVGTVYNPFLVYAANPQVSGNGRIQLPPLLVQAYGQYWFTMMMQDNGPMTVVQTVVLSWINDNDDGHLGKNGTVLIDGYSSGNHIGCRETLITESYNMQLDFNYTDSKARRVQIRVHGYWPPINYWVPYDN